MIFALESAALVLKITFGLCLTFGSKHKKKSRVRLKEISGKLEKLENQVSIWGTNNFFTKLQNFPRTHEIFNKARIYPTLKTTQPKLVQHRYSFLQNTHEHCIEWLVFHAKTKVCHLYQEIFSSHNWVKLFLDQYSQQIYFLLLSELHIFVILKKYRENTGVSYIMYTPPEIISLPIGILIHWCGSLMHNVGVGGLGTRRDQGVIFLASYACI